MSLEKILVHRDVLVRHEPLARFVLGYAVNEQRGVSVAEAVEEYGDVDGHGGD
jgi:hypothetical protein